MKRILSVGDTMLISKNKQCRGCKGTKFKLWLCLGEQPPANSLPKLPNEKTHFFPLDVYICKGCGLVQLLDIVNPELLFGDYVYYSSTSQVFVDHFKNFAREITKKFNISYFDFIVDIGGNDGILLKPFPHFVGDGLGPDILNIEPGGKVADEAIKNGVPTIKDWFSVKLARKIVKKYRHAKIITATNVFAHINDSDEVLEGVKILLSANGVFIVEAPYLWDMIDQGTFDLIYHEHLSYFDISTMETLVERLGFTLFDYKHVGVHGGSIRYFIDRGFHTPQRKKLDMIKTEEYIRRKSTLMTEFKQELRENRKEFVDLIESIKRAGGKIVGFGAPAKASTLLNWYDLGSESFDFIVDDSPAKVGRYISGVKIPIKPTKELYKTNPSHVVVFAWNFFDSIKKKLRQGGYKGVIIHPFIKNDSTN